MKGLQLQWEDHGKALSNKLWEFFNEDYLVDFSVTCHGQQKKVHKFILAFLFPMLKESLRSTNDFSLIQEELSVKDEKFGNLIPSTPLSLNLDNITEHAEDMHYLIQFAYTGKATVPKEHADCLMHIADTMEIKGLKDSLDQCQDKTTRNNGTTPCRLRPRNNAVKVIEQRVDIISSDDDFDIHSLVNDEESSPSKSFDSNENSDDVSEDSSRPRKKKRLLPKRSKKVSVKKRKSTKTPQKQNTTDIEEKHNGEFGSQEETTTTSKDDRVEEKKSFKCTQCDYVGKYPCNLERHVRCHARREAKGTLKFTCSICKKGFDRKNLLNVHRDSKCGTEPLTCKYCGIKINKKATLLQHIMNKHQLDSQGNPLEKNVKCPDCDFVCYAKHQLRAHASVKHELQNKFKCKQCSFTAPYKSQLLLHDRVIHQNVRDYMCDECGYRFPNRGKLNSHVLVTHKGVKPHKCNVCNAEYSNRLSFKIHVQSHEGKVEYKFVCHICGHNLRRKCELRIHMRRKHGMQLEDAASV